MFSVDIGKVSKAALLAAALTLATGGNAAFAQSDAATPPPQHSGHARHARHAGDPLMGLLFKLKPQLALDSSQQAQWDNAVAQTGAARSQRATLTQGIKAAFDAAIANPQPDLAAVAASADAARAQSQQLQRTVRDAWLGVYANLSSTQKTLVGDALRARAAKMAPFRARRDASG